MKASVFQSDRGAEIPRIPGLAGLAQPLERGMRAVTQMTSRAYANDLGLLSEEADPATGELTGTSQALSHVGLVNAAWAQSKLTPVVDTT